MPRLHVLAWAVFAACLLACVTLTANAETRLLGAPRTVEASPTPPSGCTQSDDAASVEDCQLRAFQAQQYAATQECERNTSPSLCADMLTRTAMNAQVLIPGTPLPCTGYDPRLPAPDSCPPGTPRPYPPSCQGSAASEPRCTGN